MRVSKYLDALRPRLGVINDREVAKVMGWSHSVPSHWRTGRMFMTNAIAGQVAELLDIPVIEIIAAVEADREEVSGKSLFWTCFFQKIDSEFVEKVRECLDDNVLAGGA